MSRVPNTKARSGFNSVTHGVQGIKGLVSGKLMGRVITAVEPALESMHALANGFIAKAQSLAAFAVKADIHHAPKKNTMPFSGPEIDPSKPKLGRGAPAFAGP